MASPLNGLSLVCTRYRAAWPSGDMKSRSGLLERVHVPSPAVGYKTRPRGMRRTVRHRKQKRRRVAEPAPNPVLPGRRPAAHRQPVAWLALGEGVIGALLPRSSGGTAGHRERSRPNDLMALTAVSSTVRQTLRRRPDGLVGILCRRRNCRGRSAILVEHAVVARGNVFAAVGRARRWQEALDVAGKGLVLSALSTWACRVKGGRRRLARFRPNAVAQRTHTDAELGRAVDPLVALGVSVPLLQEGESVDETADCGHGLTDDCCVDRPGYRPSSAPWVSLLRSSVWPVIRHGRIAKYGADFADLVCVWACCSDSPRAG